MSWIKGIREQPWRVTVAAVAGLLVAIIVAGLVGIWQTHNIERVADRAFDYVELEDEGDDIRAAVLDMRHYHRNLYFSSLNSGRLGRDGVADYERAYDKLQGEIDELEDIGPYDPKAPQPEDFRRQSTEYYADFQPFVRPTVTDQAAFDAATAQGLKQIEVMAEAAEELDGLGEDLTDNSLRLVDRAATSAKLVLLAAICGLLVAGVALAYAAMRVVNELKRLYTEQQAAAQKLAEASQAKTDFIADVSHELRTPLTVLRGNAQVGLALRTDREHAEILEEIVAESKRMSRMVEDLLFLAKSDSATVPLAFEKVAVEPFLAELAGRAKVLARERGAVLETELEGEGLVRIDSQRIEQTVLILVDNAAKYGRRGGSVTLAASVRSGQLRIEVKDHGPGIPREMLPRVFERFYRLDKARSRELGGAGLGLPIAKAIIEAHGGHIEAISRPGEGTRMSLCLPLLSEPVPASEEESRVHTPE